jgi:hypothetical protein
MLSRLNSPLLAIALLAGLIWLGYTSLHTAPLEPIGYLPSQIKAVSLLAANSRALDIMSIYHIQPGESTKLVDLFGEGVQ